MRTTTAALVMARGSPARIVSPNVAASPLIQVSREAADLGSESLRTHSNSSGTQLNAGNEPEMTELRGHGPGECERKRPKRARQACQAQRPQEAEHAGRGDRPRDDQVQRPGGGAGQDSEQKCERVGGAGIPAGVAAARRSRCRGRAGAACRCPAGALPGRAAGNSALDHRREGSGARAEPERQR